MSIRLIPDDQPIPVEILDSAARMAKSGHYKARAIADATGISEQRVVRMLVSGSLTYSAKPPRQVQHGRRRW